MWRKQVQSLYVPLLLVWLSVSKQKGGDVVARALATSLALGLP